MAVVTFYGATPDENLLIAGNRRLLASGARVHKATVV
jgi:hypothetical protein